MMAAQHGYTQDPDSGDLDQASLERLDELLLRRNAARARRDWTFADALRTEMKHTLGVEIFDGIKQWRTLTFYTVDEYPPLPGANAGQDVALVRQRSEGERHAASVAREQQAEAEADIASTMDEIEATQMAIVQQANNNDPETPRSIQLQRQLAETERQRQLLFAQLEAQKADEYRHATTKLAYERNKRQPLQPQRHSNQHNSELRRGGRKQSRRGGYSGSSAWQHGYYSDAMTDDAGGYNPTVAAGLWTSPGYAQPYYPVCHQHLTGILPQAGPDGYSSAYFGYDAAPPPFFAQQHGWAQTAPAEGTLQQQSATDKALSEQLKAALHIPPAELGAPPSGYASAAGSGGGGGGSSLESLPRTPSGSIYSPAQLAQEAV